MERIGRGYRIWGRYHSFSIPGQKRDYYTEYLTYENGEPRFVHNFDNGGSITDSVPWSEEGKKRFPELFKSCRRCGNQISPHQHRCFICGCQDPLKK